MSKVDQLRQLTERIRQAEEWAGLIGKRYAGGGGGIGRLHAVGIEPTIYFQEYDGATNYHRAPAVLLDALMAEGHAQFPALLDAAFRALEARRARLALEAVDEHRQLLKEAGIDPA